MTIKLQALSICSAQQVSYLLKNIETLTMSCWHRDTTSGTATKLFLLKVILKMFGPYVSVTRCKFSWSVSRFLSIVSFRETQVRNSRDSRFPVSN